MVEKKCEHKNTIPMKVNGVVDPHVRLCMDCNKHVVVNKLFIVKK